MSAPPVLVVMGVAGSGKTTVGRALAKRLGWAFVDGDDLHPAANIAKMSAGQPLNDTDRQPWLQAVADWIEARAAAGEAGVVTCSALKRRYRDFLRDGRPQVSFVFLDISRDLVAERVANRPGHFMPASLVDSQFADLEPPAPDEPSITIDEAAPPEAQVDAIVSRFGAFGQA